MCVILVLRKLQEWREQKDRQLQIQEWQEQNGHKRRFFTTRKTDGYLLRQKVYQRISE